MNVLSHNIKVAAQLIAERESTTADKQTDKQKIKLTIPRDPDVLKLAQEIKRLHDPDDPAKSKESIAREFTKGDNKKADQLLRQLQPSRHGWLLDSPPDK